MPKNIYICSMMNGCRIVYMGTPEFAVAPLRGLIEAKYNVVGVITMPDKPQGRGMRLQSSPVKEYALSVGLPVLQPQSLKAQEFLDELRALRADLQIVVAFRMLPEVVWSMPPMGTFNLHAALLPQYRGAAPINWAIINGETETGLTTFLLDNGMDTGKILLQEPMPLHNNDTAGTLHDRMMPIGTQLVLRTVDLLCKAEQPNGISPQTNCLRMEPQIAAEELKNAPKLFKENCQIDWNKPAKEIYDFVRGLSPYPAARTTLRRTTGEEVEIKVFAAEIVPTMQDSLTFRTSSPDNIRITSLQQAGKRRISAEDFLRGWT